MSEKQRTLDLLEREYKGLCEAIDGLDEEQLCRVWFGKWSAKDIIAHIVGWQRETAGLLQRLTRGESVTLEDPEDAEASNARFVKEMASTDPAAVIAAWRRVHVEYARAADELPEAQFGAGETARRLVDRTAVDDFRRHAADIRAWRRREGIERGASPARRNAEEET